MGEGDSGTVETILELGGEGGSITLQGQRDRGGAWLFRVITNESALWDMLDEEPPIQDPPVWESWEGALASLGRYPWPQLFPKQVAPEFSDAIFDALATNEHGGPEQVARWRSLVG